jgi:hypothetical protein
MSDVVIVCTLCTLPGRETDFPLNGDGKGGRRKQCLSCMRKINRAWRAKNKQRVSAYNKKRPKRSNGTPKAV